MDPGVCIATAAHVSRASWEVSLALLEWQLGHGVPEAALAGSVLQAVKQHQGEQVAEQLLLRLLRLWKQGLPQESKLRAPPNDLENVLLSRPGLVVLFKPAGITTESAVTSLPVQTAFRTVSRLDAQTSGVLPLAVGEVAARYFQAQFASRLVQKEYVCLCEGAPLGEVGTAGMISEPLHTSGVDGLNSRTWISEEGREAYTTYLVKSRYEAAAPRPDTELILLKVRPLTGRTHQIRVHLASIGRPIVGDVVYGTGAASSVAPRLFLHCGRLRLRDLEGRAFTVRAPLPQELQESLSRLQQNWSNDSHALAHGTLLFCLCLFELNSSLKDNWQEESAEHEAASATKHD